MHLFVVYPINQKRKFSLTNLNHLSAHSTKLQFLPLAFSTSCSLIQMFSCENQNMQKLRIFRIIQVCTCHSQDWAEVQFSTSNVPSSLQPPVSSSVPSSISSCFTTIHILYAYSLLSNVINPTTSLICKTYCLIKVRYFVLVNSSSSFPTSSHLRDCYAEKSHILDRELSSKLEECKLN